MTVHILTAMNVQNTGICHRAVPLTERRGLVSAPTSYSEGLGFIFNDWLY
jgi:hypothetical protein